MRLKHFMKSCGSLAGQRRALAALVDRALRETITPTGALSFGAVPVGEYEGRLVLATVPEAHPGCESALAAALGRPVALARFEGQLVREAVSRHYLSPKGEARGIDLQTFQTPDFLEDEGAAKAILSEKQGSLPADEIRVPADSLAFLDLRVHSVLRSLDVKRQVDFAPTRSMIAFRLEGTDAEGIRAVLFRDRLPSEDDKAIVSQQIFYDGDEHVHAVVARDLSTLPFVIHPSELQLAGLEGDRARFWVYDRMETVQAGGPGPRPLASWETTYYFLQYGVRMKRAMRLDVLAFALVERSKARLAEKSDVLAPAELKRVFGLDFVCG